MTDGTSEQRQEARRILGDVARQLDRKLSIEVRDIPGADRLQITMTHGAKHHQVEMRTEEILATIDDAVLRHELRLRLKRAFDTMQFRKMPDHRVTVKPMTPPVGFMGNRSKPPFGGGKKH
jgi:hypothetical protein